MKGLRGEVIVADKTFGDRRPIEYWLYVEYKPNHQSFMRPAGMEEESRFKQGILSTGDKIAADWPT